MENTTTVSRTLSVHKEHELLLKLETAGLNEDFAQRVIDSKGNDLAKKMVRLVQSLGFEPTMIQKRAREIMGRNFFGVEEAIKHFRITPTPEQLAMFAEIPFSEAVLEESKNTHVLVAVFPLSILKIRNQIASKLFYNHMYLCQGSFTPSWQLVRKTPVDDSTSKNWQEQQALIGKDDEVPTAQVMIYTIIGHYLATGERLFKHVYVRTSSVDSDGDCVSVVGIFASSNGLRIYYCWDGYRDGHLGVSSSRKF